MNTGSLFIFIFLSSSNLINRPLICVLENNSTLAFIMSFCKYVHLCTAPFDWELLERRALWFFFDTVLPLPSTVPDTHRGHSSNSCWGCPMVHRRAVWENQTLSQGHGEIRKISHRDMWSKTHSMEVTLHLEGIRWMRRNPPGLPHLACLLSYCDLKCFLGEADVINTVDWLSQTPPDSLLLGNVRKLKKSPLPELLASICQLFAFTQGW